MSAAQLFLSGFLCTLSVAMPPGPVALLCLERALTERFRAGVASGAGAATVHSCYAAILMSGADWMGAVFRVHAASAQAFGGVVLIALAFRAARGLRDRPCPAVRAGPRASLAVSWATTGAVALSNPMTVVGLAASAGTLGLFAMGLRWEAVVGAFCGSMLWWLGLCCAALVLRRQATPAVCVCLGRSAFAVMMAFGLTALVHAAREIDPRTLPVLFPSG